MFLSPIMYLYQILIQIDGDAVATAAKEIIRRKKVCAPTTGNHFVLRIDRNWISFSWH